VAARAEPRTGTTPVVAGSAATRGLPDLGVGVGLRTTHFAEILETTPDVGFFEVLSENFMYTSGRPLEFLDAIAEGYPLVMHGVSLSIGSTDPLNFRYLAELAALRDRTGARLVSDHLCFTGVLGKNLHDLLPLPLTEEALKHVASRVRAVQDYLGAPIALENPSTYVEFAGSTLREWEFLSALTAETGALLLLDVNNVHVSAFNHGFDAHEYLRGIPMDRVAQFHVAGHTHCGTHIIDSHIGPVPDPVWDLLAEARALGADAPVLLEWDAEIPEFSVVHAEARRADQYLAARAGAA